MFEGSLQVIGMSRHRKYRRCRHEYVFNNYCGAYVCVRCGVHASDPDGKYTLERCFCGWSATGNGYRELLEMGEAIEPWD